jgi:hypothetical protein
MRGAGILGRVAAVLVGAVLLLMVVGFLLKFFV